MKVLIIDDDRDHLDSISEALVLNGVKTKEFQSPIEAIKAYKSSKYDAVITDIKMREMDGIEVLKQLLVSDPNACVIVMTGYPYLGDSVAAMSKGALAFFHKPLDISNVMKVLSLIEKETAANDKNEGLKLAEEATKRVSREKGDYDHAKRCSISDDQRKEGSL